MYQQLIYQCPWNGWDVIRGETIETVTGTKQMFRRNYDNKVINFFSVKSAVKTNSEIEEIAQKIADDLNWKANTYDLDTKIAVSIESDPSSLNGNMIVITNDIINLYTPKPYFYVLKDGVVWPITKYVTDKVPTFTKTRKDFINDISMLVHRFDEVQPELFTKVVNIPVDKLQLLIKKLSVLSGKQPVTSQMTARIQTIINNLDDVNDVTNQQLLKAIGYYVDNQLSVRPKRASATASALNNILFDCGAYTKVIALDYLKDDKCLSLIQ